jgi:ribosome-associated protein
LDSKEKNYSAARAAHKALDDKFGQDIVTLDISKISILSDFFVIASGNNPSQIKAMADAASEAVEKLGLKLRHTEGSHSSSWFLLDFGGVIIHIFYRDERNFYGLERIWGDAEVVTF